MSVSIIVFKQVGFELLFEEGVEFAGLIRTGWFIVLQSGGGKAERLFTIFQEHKAYEMTEIIEGIHLVKISRTYPGASLFSALKAHNLELNTLVHR